jgi:hypothetical protein
MFSENSRFNMIMAVIKTQNYRKNINYIFTRAILRTSYVFEYDSIDLSKKLKLNELTITIQI